ncbi:SCO3374 family protein [Streptomyces sp. H27-D2]|nr:SCO3374 family protein [Streptomyces sp. H27-D2]MEC4016867.1 SCO3374 family protein [Streptomyces sp. H27-D2]
MPLDGVRRWYEYELGWPTTGGGGRLRLPAGVRFDVLDLPAEAGFAVLRRVGRTGPVALDRQLRRVRLLVAAGSAEQLPELLDWLEWGGVALDLAVLGPGDDMLAPVPPAPPARRPARASAQPPRQGHGSREAAVWLRPPEPGCEVEPTLPTTALAGGSRTGGAGRAPDLVRLVGTAATECHRTRLLRAQRIQHARNAQPFAFSYASRTVAGTRPRSLTS